MTLDQVESISVIAASWFGILFALQQFVKSRTATSQTASEVSVTEEGWQTKYTIPVYLKWVRFYVLAIFFFALVLTNIAINNNTPTALDVISISACTGAIIFMLTGCAYKYILWQTFRSFDSNIER